MENNSQNTVENMRRSLAIARYFFPKHISVIPCPADDDNTKRENWMVSEEGKKRAMTDELIKRLSFADANRLKFGAVVVDAGVGGNKYGNAHMKIKVQDGRKKT